MTIPQHERCANCSLYRHVPIAQRTGKQWLHTTGRCDYKPPSSKRPVPPRVDFDNWCDNWTGTPNMDVSKAIIEEGNRRYEEKLARGEIKQSGQDVQMIAPEETPLKDAGEAMAAEKARDVTPEVFVDRSYRPHGSLFPQEGETEPGPEPEPDRLSEAYLHVQRRVADVEQEEGLYATLVSCHINALRELLEAVSEKVTVPADD